MSSFFDTLFYYVHSNMHVARAGAREVAEVIILPSSLHVLVLAR